jgi:hypothetical protein
VRSLAQRLQQVPTPVVDAGLAVALGVAITVAIGVSPEPGGRHEAAAYPLGWTIAGLVLARRRWPLAVLLASAAILVVQGLDELFTAFDQLTKRHGLEKIKTIGDADKVAGGLPDPRPGHAQAVADLALAMHEEVAGRTDYSGQPLQVRIGIDTGPVVAGVIGTSRFSYDLWGDTVNTAIRMESLGVPGCIQVTGRIYHRLRDGYRFQRRGTGGR